MKIIYLFKSKGITFWVCLFSVIVNILISPKAFSQSVSWLLNGNVLNSPSEFLGTNNEMPLVIKTNNSERARFTSLGFFGIGLTVPNQLLHVHGNSLFSLNENSIIIPSSQALKTETSYAFSAIQLTNFFSGAESNDGLQIFTKNNDAGIYLQEQGVLELCSGNSLVALLPDKKFSFFSKSLAEASVNIFSHNNNGLDIKVHKTGNSQINYALNIESNSQTHDFIRASGQNKTVFNLNGKGEVFFGYGIERVSIGNTKGLGNVFATGYMGFNITRDNNLWFCKGDAANNGAVIIYSNIAGDLRIANIKTSGGDDVQLTDAQIAEKTSVFINRDGRVGIGTEAVNAPYKLAVEGTVGARRVKVTEVSFGADYVFSPDYSLLPLSEVEAFVKKNRHLPDIPSESQMIDAGLDLAEMNILLLQKVEELYLYIIEMEKRMDKLSK